MRRRVLAVVTLIMAACGGGPTSPSGETERVTWTVNGESFTATSNGLGALRVGSTLSLYGADCGRGSNLNIFISTPTVPGGIYSVADNVVNVGWTPDARTSTAANERWSAPGTARVVGGTIVRGGSGSVTISSTSAEWVSGTFSFEVVPDPSNRDTATKTLQGSFELSFRERTIC